MQHPPAQLSLGSAAGCGMVRKPFTAKGHGADASPLPTQIPPALPTRQWLRRRRAWMNPTIPSFPQQDPSVTSLSCTLNKAVYLFGFFQAARFLPVICRGPSFPSYAQAVLFCFCCKNTLLFLLFSSPNRGSLSAPTHTHFSSTNPPRFSQSGAWTKAHAADAGGNVRP